MNAGWEVIGGKAVASEMVFQVCFKLFQVRGGSIWGGGGYAWADETSYARGAENAGKCLSI
jgi:hypothetical protein